MQVVVSDGKLYCMCTIVFGGKGDLTGRFWYGTSVEDVKSVDVDGDRDEGGWPN
jgi:hypothetical protein